MYDGYRIELDTLSRAIVEGTGTAFGRDDAVAQARALEAVRSASLAGTPVDMETTEATLIATSEPTPEDGIMT